MSLGGGEPTLRSDFPKLVEALGERATVATDALALHTQTVASSMHERGMRNVRIPIHSARADAHDWMTGIPGAHRRVRRAIEALQTAGVNIQAEVALARPTAPYLEETVAFLLRSGVMSIRFRMLRRLGPKDQRFVTTAPRFGLMEPSLDAALRLALKNDMSVELQGLPHCVIPDFDEFHIPQPAWVLPAGIDAPLSFPESNGGCPGCDCMGAPQDYVSTFGWTEFNSERSGKAEPVQSVPLPQSGEDAMPPPARAGRQPATRVAEAIRLAEEINVGGDPTAGREPGPVPSLVAVRFPQGEPTRSIKQRLVDAAQQGATTLQVAGTLNHSDALTLLREALRLSFAHVVVTADLSGLAPQPNNKLFHLRGLTEIWCPNNEANTDVAERIKTLGKVEYRCVDEPASEDPVPLRGPPGTEAAQFEVGDSWPQWRPNTVH
jgi:MoaA/NifB/PqqE/SkfB family radical SAM enzyme